MARTANRLTAVQVAKATRPGVYADGGGLYLRVAPAGNKFWVLIWTQNGKRREMGMGAASGAYAVSLASAREGAAEARTLIGQGKCPLAQTRAAKAAAEAQKPTFASVADEYLATMRPKWKSDVYARQWEVGLKTKSASLRPLPVDSIGVVDVLAALKPVWLRTPETGRRLRGQIEAVLDAATARGLRVGSNPAAWKGNLKALLPARAEHQRSHHAALPFRDMAAFMADLRAQEGVAARALEFTILVAARSGEVRQATWAQIDMRGAVWIVPARAMKANREHRVPLCGRALAILREIEASRMSDTVFPSYDGGPMSVNAMLAVLARMGRVGITVHGFRSAFRDFAGEVSNAPHEVCEAALAHTIRNKAEAAYRRGDMFEKRRALMDQWAQWCEPKAKPVGNVVSMLEART